MTPSLLQRVGVALYGTLWRGSLADELDVRDDTVRQWLSGRMDVPPGVVVELRGLLADRRGMINNLLCDLAVEEEKT